MSQKVEVNKQKKKIELKNVLSKEMYVKVTPYLQPVDSKWQMLDDLNCYFSLDQTKGTYDEKS